MNQKYNDYDEKKSIFMWNEPKILLKKRKKYIIKTWGAMNVGQRASVKYGNPNGE